MLSEEMFVDIKSDTCVSQLHAMTMKTDAGICQLKEVTGINTKFLLCMHGTRFFQCKVFLKKVGWVEMAATVRHFSAVNVEI